jgi:hypothetical protein
VTVNQLFSLLSKLGGLAVGVLGVNTGSIKEMTIGPAFAAIIHAIDSLFNSPRNTPPTP